MSESRTCLKCGKINEASNSLCIECNAALTLDESDNLTIANSSLASDLSDDDFDDVVTEHNIDQMFAASNPPLEQTKVELESDETVIIEDQSIVKESDSGATTLIAEQNSTVAEADSTLIAESFVDPIKRHKATMSRSSLESVDDITTDWEIGDTIIGLYHISDLLGEGGMGKVYKVRHLGWNVELAVKSPKLEALASLGGPEIFEEEAKTWVDLGLHPHIVSCYYVRRLGNIPRIFAEYIRNCSLKDLIKSGKLRDLATLIDIGVQAAWGLEYSHKMGLVHQDIKPANIMITEKNIAKVTDFGLAKWRSGSSSDSVDRSDNLVEFSGMTPAYCSPEQANRASLSAKTDIWSWGLTFLEMLAGERTWLNGVAAPEALDRHVEASKKEDGVGFKIPAKIATLLNNIFQDNPEDRPGSMLLVADQLAQIYGELFDQKYMREFPKISRVTTDSLNNKAISLIDLDHIEKGIQTLEQAVVNEPNHPEATLNYALMKWRIGDITDSVVINMLEEMIKHQSLETSAFYYLALAHMERDDCKKALEALETIISSDPRIEEVKALQNLAREQLDKSKKLDLTFDFHTESVNAIALSGKRNILLTGSDDHSAKLIDIATNKVLYKFEPTSLAITSVALSEDGTIAAVGSYRQIDLYNLQDGTKIKTLDMEGGWVTMLKIDSSNKYIGSAISDESLKITDIDSNLVLSSFPTFYGCCSISDNFKRVLFQNKEGSCELLDVNKEEQLKLFDQTCSAVKLNEDGTIAAIANLNGHIDIWSTDQPSLIMTLKGHDKIVSNLLFLDNDFLISSSYDRTIRLWDLHDKRCIRTFAGHDATLNSIAISSDKKYLYSADSSGKVLRWKVRNLGSEFTAPIMVSKVSASELVLSAGIEYENGITQMRQALDDGDYLSAIQHLKSARRQTGFHKGSEAIREWGNLYPFFAKKGFKAGWEQSSLTHRNAPINAIDISFYGSMAITGSQDQTAIVWNLATEEPLATFSDAQGAISDVSISKDASAALTASTDGKLRLYNVKSGKLIKTVAGHIGAINGAVLSYDARFFLSAGSDSFINLWSTEYNEPIRKFRGHNQAVLGVKLHPAGALAISFSADRTARVWNVATGDCLRTLAPGYGAVNSAAISLDQKQALLACETGMIVLYDLVKAEPIKNLEGHEGSVSSILFSFDQKFCLSTDVNRTVRLWDLESGTNLSVFEGHQSTVNDIALATDGRIAISAGDDGQAKTWILDWELNELKQSGWDDNAKIFLENFISYHTPYMAEFPQSRKPFDREIVLALSRSGTPEFSPSFQTELQYMLGAAGFGWIDNKTLVSEFDKIVSNWKGSIKSPISTDSSLYIDDDQIDEMETHHYRSEFINTEKKTLLSQWFRSSNK